MDSTLKTTIISSACGLVGGLAVALIGMRGKNQDIALAEAQLEKEVIMELVKYLPLNPSNVLYPEERKEVIGDAAAVEPAASALPLSKVDGYGAAFDVAEALEYLTSDECHRSDRWRKYKERLEEREADRRKVLAVEAAPASTREEEIRAATSEQVVQLTVKSVVEAARSMPGGGEPIAVEIVAMYRDKGNNEVLLTLYSGDSKGTGIGLDSAQPLPSGVLPETLSMKVRSSSYGISFDEHGSKTWSGSEDYAVVGARVEAKVGDTPYTLNLSARATPKQSYAGGGTGTQVLQGESIVTYKSPGSDDRK